jgi:hypothetical protein
MLISSWLDRSAAHARTSRVFSMHALGCAAALCAWAVAPQHAHAGPTLAGDLDVVAPVGSHYHEAGGGFGIRLGEELHLPLIALNPEIGFEYASFAGDKPAADGPQVYRGIVGARLGIGEVIRFGLLAHIGFGHLALDPTPLQRLRGEGAHTAVTYDVGLFLELTLLPLLNVGLHAIYNNLQAKDNGDPLQWMQAGVHVALVF